jgi:phosphoribosylformylglycinamidine synthase
VLKQEGKDTKAAGLQTFLAENFGINDVKIRTGFRYDADGLSEEEYGEATRTIFSEAPVDDVFDDESFESSAAGKTVILIESLPGQYDQKDDSAAQCVELSTGKRVHVKSASVLVLDGQLPDHVLTQLKAYLINKTDSREAARKISASLESEHMEVPDTVPDVENFFPFNAKAIRDHVKFIKSNQSVEQIHDAQRLAIIKKYKLAMTVADMKKVQQYFTKKRRPPTETELKVIDTYWSDHCRHTTFTTALKTLKLEGQTLLENGTLNAIAQEGLSESGKAIARATQTFMSEREELYGADHGKDVSLMDLALFSMRQAKEQGLLDDLEDTEENNAASIVVPVHFEDGHTEEWLFMFKNETHNHPSEIEPYGGAATCLGGAIRDPLSGRVYVMMGMRVSGSGDPREPLDETMPGKLAQRRITTGAADGFAGYGNQIGLSTPHVKEYYHKGYKAKRFEAGFTAGAAPRENVVREKPNPGDVIIVLGGRTGRDGIGGASGSSVAHDQDSVSTRGAEVQKGNAVIERHIQALFRRPEVSKRIKRCNDFGAGGASVAIGEIAEGSRTNLDLLPKKYEGLDGTELATSESQERMAIVVSKEHAAEIIKAAAEENLEATVVGDVTEERVLKMEWKGKTICELDRDFLAGGWAERSADVSLQDPGDVHDFLTTEVHTPDQTLPQKWLLHMQSLAVASQRGLQQRFDSTVGANTVVGPFGGLYGTSPNEASVMKFPAEGAKTRFAVSESFDPDLSSRSPYHGGMYAVVDSIAKLVATGASPDKVRLTLQNYFGKLSDAERWGQPFLAQLGAREAQKHLEAAGIGGKDSMSGTYINNETGERIDVPPTLVCFATKIMQEEQVIPSHFQSASSTVVHLRLQPNEAGEPDWNYVKTMWAKVHELQQKGIIKSSHAVHAGGAAAALTEMCAGNRIGFSLEEAATKQNLFASEYGSMIVELPEGQDAAELFAGLDVSVLGKTQEEQSISLGSQGTIPLSTAQEKWEEPLDSIFPLEPQKQYPKDVLELPPVHVAGSRKAAMPVAKPKVSVLVFPGNNCEYESKAAFDRAGADAQILRFLNCAKGDIRESLVRFAKAINESQIVMLPGGFSAGDEPDGSAKYMANVLRSPVVRDAMHEHIDRGGLVLGVCNGFQGLVKSCLLPDGRIREQQRNDVTLAHNDKGHFLSMQVKHRVGSLLSPWMANHKKDDVDDYPIAHGEGKLINVPIELIANGQVPFYYAGRDGKVRMSFDSNPNGSEHAIAALTDKTGRIFGMMAHPERAIAGLRADVPTEKKGQKIFDAGVKYFA